MTRKGSWNGLEIKQLKKLVDQGKRIAECAAELNRSYHSVRDCLVRQGIPLKVRPYKRGDTHSNSFSIRLTIENCNYLLHHAEASGRSMSSIANDLMREAIHARVRKSHKGVNRSSGDEGLPGDHNGRTGDLSTVGGGESARGVE